MRVVALRWSILIAIPFMLCSYLARAVPGHYTFLIIVFFLYDTCSAPVASAPEVNGGAMDVDEPAPAPVQEKKKGWFGFGR